MRRSRWNGIRRLMRMLELGLILVSFHRKTPRVEVVLDPSPYRKQKKNKERRALITEMNNRSGHWNEGGTRGKVVTAYREDALAVACCLAKFGPLSPAQLRELGVAECFTPRDYDMNRTLAKVVDLIRQANRLEPYGELQ